MGKMRILFTLCVIAAWSVTVFSFGSSAYAADPDPTVGTSLLSGEVSQESIAGCVEAHNCFCIVLKLVTQAVKMLFGILGSLALLAFVYGGVMWVISRGESSYVTKGKDAMKNAIIGIVLALFSYAIVNLILIALLQGKNAGGPTEDGQVTFSVATIMGRNWSSIQCIAPPKVEPTPTTPAAPVGITCATVKGECVRKPTSATQPNQTQKDACNKRCNDAKILCLGDCAAITKTPAEKTTCDTKCTGIHSACFTGCATPITANNVCVFSGAIEESVPGCKADEVCCRTVLIPQAAGGEPVISNDPADGGYGGAAQ